MICSKKAIADVGDSGRICILDIDMQGVQSIKKTDLNCRYFFVKPPSLEELVCATKFLLGHYATADHWIMPRNVGDYAQ